MPASRAGSGKKHRLGEHLPHQPAAAGAQPHAHRQFLLPPRRSRQQHARHVDARQQQQQSYHGHQQGQRFAVLVAHPRQARAGRQQLHPVPDPRIHARGALHAWYSTAISAWACWMVTPGFNRASMVRSKCSAGIQTSVREPTRGPTYCARRHPDDDLRRVVVKDALAENRRIAMEATVPVGPTHYRHVAIAAGRDILGADHRPIAGFNPSTESSSPGTFSRISVSGSEPRCAPRPDCRTPCP